ncbi:MAG: formate dehydrogenase subunit delta [Dokdonella sp.]
MSSSYEHLVQMANDIGHFFQSEPDHEAAVAGVAAHIRRYWEPRMRKHIYAHLDAGGAGLTDIARDAITRLAEQARAAAS